MCTSRGTRFYSKSTSISSKYEMCLKSVEIFALFTETEVDDKSKVHFIHNGLYNILRIFHESKHSGNISFNLV